VLAAGAALLLSGSAQATENGAHSTGVPQPCSSLSLLALRRQWFWGSSFDRQALGDADMVQLMKTHAAVLVTENALKWEVVNPRPGVQDLSDFAALEARFGPSGMRFRGHPLVARTVAILVEEGGTRDPARTLAPAHHLVGGCSQGAHPVLGCGE